MFNIYLQLVFAFLCIAGILGIIWFAWSRQVDFVKNSGYIYYQKHTDQIAVTGEKFQDSKYTYIGEL